MNTLVGEADSWNLFGKGKRTLGNLREWVAEAMHKGNIDFGMNGFGIIFITDL